MLRLKLFCQLFQFPLELTIFIDVLFPHEFYKSMSRMMMHDHIGIDLQKHGAYILGTQILYLKILLRFFWSLMYDDLFCSATQRLLK
jgi:hypothetical protein